MKVGSRAAHLTPSRSRATSSICCSLSKSAKANSPSKALSRSRELPRYPSSTHSFKMTCKRTQLLQGQSHPAGVTRLLQSRNPGCSA